MQTHYGMDGTYVIYSSLHIEQQKSDGSRIDHTSTMTIQDMGDRIAIEKILDNK